MTYVRLDYAVIVFIMFAIISMIREIYKDYKFKIKPSDYDIGYHQAIEDVCNEWNSINKNTNYKDHCRIMRMYLQNKFNGR